MIEGKKDDWDWILLKNAKEKLCLDIAGMMMNATPDILVQYTIGKGKRTYIKALECKYESGEGRYVDVAGVNCKMQFFIQECIMLFLFGHRINDKESYHCPQCPEGGKVWGIKGRDTESEDYKRKIEIWEEIFLKVYKNIMKQECIDGKISNTGVEVIKFVTPNSEKGAGEEKWKEIKIEELLAITYCPPEKKREESR